MWFVWLGPVPQSAVYGNGDHLRCKPSVARPQWVWGGRSKLKSCAARRKALKDKGKGQGNSDLGCIPQLGVSHPASVGIVHASEAEESVASFQGPGALSEQQHL